MKPVSGRDFAKLLERNGWRLPRVNGSHHIYGKAGVDARLGSIFAGASGTFSARVLIGPSGSIVADAATMPPFGAVFHIGGHMVRLTNAG